MKPRLILPHVVTRPGLRGLAVAPTSPLPPLTTNPQPPPSPPPPPPPPPPSPSKASQKMCNTVAVAREQEKRRRRRREINLRARLEPGVKMRTAFEWSGSSEG